MIYEPNTTEWPVGALVIHDADAKRSDMLMRVIGRDNVTGEYTTRYAYPAEQPKYWRRKMWKNNKRYLHDPARFGIKVPNVQGNRQLPAQGDQE